MTKDNTISNKLYKLLFALFSCVVGLSFLFMMLKDVPSTNWYKSRFQGWKTITAEVSDFTTSPENRSTPAYYPIYHCVVDGQTYQGISELSQDEVPKSGQTISIFYNPKSPEQSQYKNDIPIPVLVLITLPGFLLFMALAVLSLYQAFNPPQEPKSQPKAAKSISIVEGTVRKENPIVSLVYLSLIMIALTYICITATGQFKAVFYGWKTTTAQVIDYDVYETGRSRGGRGGFSLYSSIYQYQVDGVAYEGYSVLGRFTKPKIQSQIPIAYNPEYPYQSASSENRHFFYIVFLPGFSLLLVGKALSLIIAAWIKKASLAQAKKTRACL